MLYGLNGEESQEFKVNFTKSYDSIRWSFLENMLEQVGVGLRMRRWIMWFAKSALI